MIRADCTSCGTIEVAISDARLQVGVLGDEPANSVEFRCPKCGRLGHQRVDERGTRLLSSAGITAVLAAPTHASSRGEQAK